MTVLYTLTALLGAGLLFLVQPMVARMLLPSYGGAATVWATCSLFFQVVLLLGYVFVHASTRLGPRQPLLHLPLLLLPLAVLPVTLPSDAAPDSSPALWLLRTLLVMVGLPFAVLSTTGPVLQRWYSWLDVPRAHDPYFLYAASNVGSFGGLLAYPFLVEPYVDLGGQQAAWSVGFVVFLALLAACGAVAFRAPRVARGPVAGACPSAGRMLRWVGLAFVPSSLMLGVTTHITTDITPVPLLWVLPLAIYLATFVIAFGRSGRALPARTAAVAVLLVIVVKVLPYAPFSPPFWVSIAAALAMLGAVALAAHGLLAADRPEPDQLTLFFVLVSVGGALGGLFNGLLAPVLFDRVLEYDLAMAAVPLLWLAAGATRWITVAMAAALAISVFLPRTPGDVLERSRTFYGSYTVYDDTDRTSLWHGTTVHGFQSEEPGLRDEPTSYYARSGPLGDVFDVVAPTDVTAVGLGTGTVAAYGEAGQTFRFVEIDPEVVRIAEDPRLFSYLEDSPAEIEMLVGDGRLRVAELPESSTDLLILDAFSSDAIPVHLLTAEAFQSYAPRVTAGGAIVVHISNRYFDLRTVVAGAAGRLGWEAAWSQGGTGPLALSSRWVVLSPADGLASRLVAESEWTRLNASSEDAWTDDHASLLDVLQ